MNRILGIILVLIGILGIAITSIPELKPYVPIPLPVGLSDNVIFYGSIIVALLGLFIIVKTRRGFSGRQAAEVPIYRGKNVVGYRRLR